METYHFDYITKFVKETHSFKDSLALCEETHTVNALLGRHNVILISVDVDLINFVWMLVHRFATDLSKSRKTDPRKVWRA